MNKRRSTASTATPDGVVHHREVDDRFLANGKWDGTTLSYVPSPRLQVSPDLQFHEAFEHEVDPITYQILRWRFWNLNLEHGDTIRRICGSYMIVYTADYNTWMLTENGDTVLGGPSIQYFVGMADLTVKWTLEHRSGNPGIEDGDVFIHNDPWIATAHQMDTAIFAPFFWEGKIFSWFFSAAHQKDLGGVNPGSFCYDARDSFDEPGRWPPTKIVRRGVIQDDVVGLFARQSRIPESTTLQLRSQFAGINACRKRMTALLEEFGPDVVKGAMRAMIRDSSNAVSERLLSIPDGEFSEHTYYARKNGTLLPIRTTIRKEADRLIVGNDGTGEQLEGQSGNGTYHSFRSGALAALGTILAWDQLYTPGGVMNHLEFEPVPGTMTVSNFPAAVTLVAAPVFSMVQAYQALSKMVLTGPHELHARANAMGALSNCFTAFPYGLDVHGHLRFGAPGDVMVGSLGAFPDRDGIDTGGAWWWPSINGGNVEEMETDLPSLYLYRREQVDSGGPGRFRGGLGIEAAYISHKARQFWFAGFGNDTTVNSTPGLSGGYPGRNNALAKESTQIKEVLASGRIPTTRAELLAAIGELDRFKANGAVEIAPDGIVVSEWSSGGGYGDPLRRDPAAVLNDVINEDVSVEGADRFYGVIITDDKVDIERTEVRRSEVRARRLRGATPAVKPFDQTVTPSQDENRLRDGAVLDGEEDALVWACGECGRVLAPANGNYRFGCALIQSSPNELDEILYPDPDVFLLEKVVFRRWFCPACGQQINMECVLETDEVTWDARVGAKEASENE